MFDGVQKSLDTLGATMKDSQQLLRHVDARVTPMADNLMEPSTRLRATTAHTQQVVDGNVVRVLRDTNKTLGQVLAAAVASGAGGGSIKAAAQWEWGDVQNAMDLFARRLARNLSALTTGAATPADLPLPD